MSGFKVRGVLDGAVYDVTVTTDERYPIVGNARVAALVQSWAGRPVQITPTGPVRTVTAADPASILALLSAQTDIRDVGEGAPQLLPPPPRGRVD